MCKSGRFVADLADLFFRKHSFVSVAGHRLISFLAPKLHDRESLGPEGPKGQRGVLGSCSGDGLQLPRAWTVLRLHSGSIRARLLLFVVGLEVAGTSRVTLPVPHHSSAVMLKVSLRACHRGCRACAATCGCSVPPTAWPGDQQRRAPEPQAARLRHQQQVLHAGGRARMDALMQWLVRWSMLSGKRWKGIGGASKCDWCVGRSCQPWSTLRQPPMSTWPPGVDAAQGT
jgi:hypothetical protein